MPLSTTIADDLHLVHTIYDGPYQAEILLNYFKEIWSDEKYANYHEIFDARNMDVEAAEFTSLLMIAKSSTKSYYDNPTTKKAIIVKNGQQKDFMDFYQSARSLLSIQGSSTLKLFDNISEAKNWLGA